MSILRSAANPVLLAGFLTLAGTASGCSKDDSRPGPATAPPGSLPADKANTRYMKIRTLLGLPPQARRRATELYGLVRPLCTDEAVQDDFLQTARWSVGYGSQEFYLPIKLAIEVLEHVTSVCMRTSETGTMRLLRTASDFLAGDPRYHILIARALATADRLDEASVAAKKAVELGSAHGVALAANIEARRARDTAFGFREGLLDSAIAIASEEPTAEWLPIDLSALLATRARLLLERAFWSDNTDSRKTRLESIEVLKRIVRGPFPFAVRTRAADGLCFESADLGVEAAARCEAAARTFRHLGAALYSGVELSSEHDRTAPLAKLKARIATMAAGSLVLMVFRGDEQELLEWARPATHLLRTLEARDVDLLVLDRGRGARATALIERTLALAEVEPWLYVSAQQGTQTMPCVAALLAGRRTPQTCPLSRKVEGLIAARKRPSLALLIGRDLDAEIDDLRLYEHPVALVSFRKSEMEKKGIDAWLKSLSDVLVVAPAPKH